MRHVNHHANGDRVGHSVEKSNLRSWRPAMLTPSIAGTLAKLNAFVYRYHCTHVP